jgi:hypothetical protein
VGVSAVATHLFVCVFSQSLATKDAAWSRDRMFVYKSPRRVDFSNCRSGENWKEIQRLSSADPDPMLIAKLLSVPSIAAVEILKSS